MGNSCGRSLKVCALRVVKLEADGSPDVGAGNMYTTDSLITMTVGTEYGDDDDFEVRFASGDIGLAYFAFGPLKRLSFDIDLGTADPELHAMLINESTLSSGDAVGFRYPEIGVGNGCTATGPNGVGIEAWTRHVGQDGALDPTFPYLRWLFPRTTWRVGEKNFENAPMSHKFTGTGIENPQWLDGPANDWPVLSDRAGQWLPVATAPTPACGSQTVSSS